MVAIIIAGDIHLEGLSGRAVTLCDHAETNYEVDLEPFVSVPGQYECFLK